MTEPDPRFPPDRITADLLDKADAGAVLVFALYHAPVDWWKALLKDAPRGVVDAYGRACKTYRVGRNPPLRAEHAPPAEVPD